jgi:hypothetical protein
MQFPADGKFGPNVLVGWQNRIMIVTQAIWLAIIERQVKKQMNNRTKVKDSAPTKIKNTF